MNKEEILQNKKLKRKLEHIAQQLLSGIDINKTFKIDKVVEEFVEEQNVKLFEAVENTNFSIIYFIEVIYFDDILDELKLINF